jgi:phosphate transport system permease protein
MNMKKIKEKLIEGLLFSSALFSILVTLGIMATLIVESIPFFKVVSLKEFFTATEWSPLFSNPVYGILPLVMGTFVTTFVALLVAIPAGTIVAIYLSEYASPKVRELLKPILELLSAIPTVVYGHFALLFVIPILQKFIPQLSGTNMLGAGLVMGIMIIPYVSSLSEDAMRNVPMFMREGSFALGASRLQTSLKVVYPSALSGISASYILGISRAIGETMVVAIAAGMQPNFTFSPLEPAQTITSYIVQVSMGDLPHDSIGYQSIFVAGLTLMVMTFSFNILGHFISKKFRQVY